MKGLIGVLLIALIVLISGCTQTGELIDAGEENLTPEEELILEEFLDKTPEISDANETGQNASPVSAYTGYIEPQDITQLLGCPETCDDEDNCTYDYCSKDTDYECVHAERICPNTVRMCDDGVEVICKNICIDDFCTTCKPDCSEHQLPVCELTQDDCGLCQTLDTDNCECARITSCVNNDNCCPEGCNYTSDNDCAEPEGECSEDWECDDANNCTIDRCEGIPKNCSHEEITECAGGDGCCPEGCDYANDTDCEEPEQGLDHLVFSEVYYDAKGDDYANEWLEIYNPTRDAINLSGWSISDNSGTWKFPEITIESSSYIIIARDSEGFQNISQCLPDIDTFTRGLNNNGDQLSLKNSNLQLIDFVAWESGADNAYPDWDIEAGNGKSIKRKSLTEDTDSPEDWLSDQEPEPNC